MKKIIPMILTTLFFASCATTTSSQISQEPKAPETSTSESLQAEESAKPEAPVAVTEETSVTSANPEDTITLTSMTNDWVTEAIAIKYTD